MTTLHDATHGTCSDTCRACEMIANLGTPAHDLVIAPVEDGPDLTLCVSCAGRLVPLPGMRAYRWEIDGTRCDLCERVVGALVGEGVRHG